MSRAVTDLELPCKERALALLDQVRIRLGINLIIVHTLRTWSEQANIYAQGRTRPGVVVTNAKPGYSWHNFGLAFDVAIKSKDGKITWAGPWDKIGPIGEELGLVWGGRFDINKKKVGQQPDPGHFEYRPDGETLATLRSKYETYLAKKGGHDEIKWA